MRYLFKLLFVSIMITTSLFAHQTALSYLELKMDSEMMIEVLVKKPAQDIESDDLKIEFPRSCQDILPQTTYHDKGFSLFKRSLWCGENGLSGSSIWVSNLLESDKGVVFRYESADLKIENRLLTAYAPYIMIESSQSQSSFSYLWLGVEHILLGIDHLLFVLALLLMVPNLTLLIQTITAFTLSHSLTLGLATLGLVNFSVPYIEMMIALSIIFLARELLRKKEVKTLTHTHPWIIAFAFGLLHGLGFASALHEVGLPSEHIMSSLLFFNLGVESGQLAFIFMVLIGIRMFSKMTVKYHDEILKKTAYFIGIVAAYWFVERSLLLIL